MIFLLLLLILIINCILLKYSIIPLIYNVIINNAVFYLNIVLFIANIIHQKKTYDIKNKNLIFSYFFPLLLILFYFLIRKTTILAKPFSDFFGYHVIRSDLNNLLNVKKKHRGINIFIKFFFIDILFKIMSTINSKSDISIKLKELKDSNKIEKTEYFESITDKERYDNNWKTFINSIPFNSNGIQHNFITKEGEQFIALKKK